MARRKSRYLYEATRLGILEHFKDGRLPYAELSLHNLLRLYARESHILGCVFTSAPTVARDTGHSSKTAQRLLVKLEDGRYIRRFWKRGWRGDYPVLIHKFTVWNGTHELRLDAFQSRDWRKPLLVPVHEGGYDVVSQEVSHRGGLINTINYQLDSSTTTDPVENGCSVCGIETFESEEKRAKHMLSEEHLGRWIHRTPREEKP